MLALVHIACGLIAEDIGVVARAFHGFAALPEVAVELLAHAGFVREVVDGTVVIAKEIVVAAALWPKGRRLPQMPFADQGGVIAGLLEQRRQSGVFGRQAQLAAVARQRLLQPRLQAVLITARDKRNACGRAHGRVGICLVEAHALGGEAVQVRSLEIGGAIDAEIGPAQIVGQYENNVRSGHGISAQCHSMEKPEAVMTGRHLAISATRSCSSA